MGERKPLTSGQWLVLAAAFLGWMFDGMELGLFPMVSRACLQDLLPAHVEGDVAAWNGRILACFLVGAALGGVAFGWLGDKIGRVRAMMCSILTYSLFMGAGYFAEQPWHLGLLLFFSALGMGGQWSLGVALVMESWPEKSRPLLSGIIGAASNVGFLLDWRRGIVFFGDSRLLAMDDDRRRQPCRAGVVDRRVRARIRALERVVEEGWRKSDRRDLQAGPEEKDDSGNSLCRHPVDRHLGGHFGMVARLGRQNGRGRPSERQGHHPNRHVDRRHHWLHDCRRSWEEKSDGGPPTSVSARYR